MIIFFITYQIVQLFFIPFIGLYFLIRKIKKKPVFGNLSERIGLVPKASQATYWFHAVSVGEVLSLQTFINKIKTEAPNSLCYVTVGTITGKRTAKEKLKADYISFLPFDFLPCILYAFNRIKPKTLIIVEAEIWPNLLMIAHYKKINASLINARISKRSKNKYTFGKKILAPLFNIFKTIYTQSKYDTSLFKTLGVKETKLITMGNLKAYNVLKKYNEEEKLPKPKNPTLLVGSLHPGELDIYIKLFQSIKSDYPTLKLILAPRHFHWKEELINKIQKTKYSYAILDEQQTPKENYDILLICKLGELFHLYQQSTIYFLGGTFVPIGGHNLYEPAVHGNAIIIGPYDSNCKVFADELKRNNGIIRVKNVVALISSVKNLLGQPSKINILGYNAKAWLEQEAAIVKQNTEKFIKDIL